MPTVIRRQRREVCSEDPDGSRGFTLAGETRFPQTHLMDKLVEREPAHPRSSLATAPALAVQFFLIPLAVVVVIVLLYGGFRMMVTSERAPEEFLSDVRGGGRDRRWPAAYELSRLLMDPAIEAEHPGLGRAIVQAFQDSEGDDPLVRQYLALAIGRLEEPPDEATAALTAALDVVEPETLISVIWALASIGEVGVASRIEETYESDDAGVRKMAVYALGTLPADNQGTTLLRALDDPVADVQWNAAVALARHGRAEAVPVLRRMLNREYVARSVSRTAAPDAPIDPVSEVMVSGLQAVAALQASELRSQVETLSEDDMSLRVREVAMKALEVLGPVPVTLNSQNEDRKSEDANDG